jgi:hypothetical protein
MENLEHGYELPFTNLVKVDCSKNSFTQQLDEKYIRSSGDEELETRHMQLYVPR